MKTREVTVKGILNTVPGEDEWFGLSYNMNLYRGCEHQCIYCDTRSTCYQIEHFDEEVLVKTNSLALLEDTLPRKRKKGIIGFGSMNDPYTPAERRYGLTGKALEIVAKYRFPVHIITKSDMVRKDLETLVRINQVKARVSFTVTTTDDALARVLEPGAPAPSRRLAAMARLADAGVETGVVMMPILPFIEDSPENIEGIVRAAAQHNADYIIPSFGMTLREGSREYYYQKLDQYFPGLRRKYEKTFGDSYHCPARNADELARLFYSLCEDLGLKTKVSSYPPKSKEQQLSLF
ncbi:radical SAM protein [bacterium]|nr:radical SAM protein [bacterium]